MKEPEKQQVKAAEPEELQVKAMEPEKLQVKAAEPEEIQVEVVEQVELPSKKLPDRAAKKHSPTSGQSARSPEVTESCFTTGMTAMWYGRRLTELFLRPLQP